MAQGYTVLARRYRSQDFGQLLGQEPIAQTLRNAVSSGRIAHAFIFTGTRGVGKTSAARILAKAINCPAQQHGEPCGKCGSCKAIAVGEDIDVIEIDGASNNGVDQIRELRQNAGISPARSPFKIYIIDEVHMLTTQAFNALLKTLEEPPPHVKFIFATTDIHRVPATILSRCQRYDFKNIPTDVIAGHLAAICKEEKAAAQAAALHRIAVLAAGSMRDALSLLDRVLSLGAGEITEALLNELVGTPPLTDMCRLIKAMMDGDAADALGQTDTLLASGMSPEYLVAELTGIFRQLMVMGVCGRETPLVDVPAEARDELARLAERVAPQLAAHHIAICDQVARNLRNSTMPRPLLDALIVRFCMAADFAPIRQWLRELPAGPGLTGTAAGSEKKNDLKPRTAPPPPAHHRAMASEPPAAADAGASGGFNTAAQAPVSAGPTETPPGDLVFSDDRELDVTPDRPVDSAANRLPASPQPEASAESIAAPAPAMAQLAPLLESLRKLGGSSAEVIAESVMDCAWAADGGSMRFRISRKMENFFQGPHIRQKLSDAARQVAGREVAIGFDLVDLPEPEAKAQGATAGGGRPAAVAAPVRVSPELQQAVQSNPGVKCVMEKLGARLTHIEVLDVPEESPAVPPNG